MAERPLTDPEFQPVFRGYDRAQVDAYVRTVRERLNDLEAVVSRLDADGSSPVVPQVPEYERIGREIGSLLQEADTVARGIRERAAAEVEAAAAAAIAEAKAMRDAAAGDAETMRGDAWTASSELLNDTQQQVAVLLSAAEDDSRSVRAEAEREAHRLVASARREADEQVRVAKMEAERLLTEAISERDEIVEGARRTADAAQERARALEVRRDELLHELESVRATVQRLETDIDEKRQQLEPEPEPVIEVETPAEPEWGGGVRIIPAPDDPEPDDGLGEPVDALAVVEEVKRLHRPKADEVPSDVVLEVTDEPDPEPDAAPDPEPETEPPAPTSLEVTAEATDDTPAVGEGRDELADLFSSLRGGTPPADVVIHQTPEPTPEAGDEVEDLIPTPRWDDDEEDVSALVERRQRAIIPIVNGALRGVKRELADAQNQALESLRVEEEWTPSQSDFGDRFGDHLAEVRVASYEAGWASVGNGDEPAGAPTASRSAFAGDLAASLVRASGRGADARARATEVSRAFRSWRSDSAERHLRTEASLAYNEGAAAAIKASGVEARVVPESRACSSCREAAQETLSVVPPFHSDCSCVVTSG